MVQKILINTAPNSEFAISRSTYSLLMKEYGWKFIGMYLTKEEADKEIARLKGIDSAPIPVTIDTKISGRGVITPMTDGSPAIGRDYAFTFTPDAGNVVYTVIIDGVDCGPVPSYTFKRLTGNHTMTVIFSATPTPAAGNVYFSVFATGGGFVTKRGNVLVTQGSTYTFRAQPYPGFKYDKIVIDGTEHDMGQIPQGTLLFEEVFTNVQNPSSIQVYFVRDTLDPLPAAPVLKYFWENAYGVWHSNITARNDPDTIAVVEYLISTNPKLINGGGATLKIVTVPDNTDWEIRKSCNGTEVVASVFEVWK